MKSTPILLALLVSIISLLFTCTHGHGVVIQTESGTIRGKQYANGFAFLGVPYARAPLREHRFMASCAHVVHNDQSPIIATTTGTAVVGWTRCNNTGAAVYAVHCNWRQQYWRVGGLSNCGHLHIRRSIRAFLIRSTSVCIHSRRRISVRPRTRILTRGNLKLDGIPRCHSRPAPISSRPTRCVYMHACTHMCAQATLYRPYHQHTRAAMPVSMIVYWHYVGCRIILLHSVAITSVSPSAGTALVVLCRHY